MKKLFLIVMALVPIGIWLYKVGNFVEVEQHNDRAEFNNSIVFVLEEVTQKTYEPRSFLQQFTQLEQLNESQQRGMWYLLEDTNFDFAEEFQEARAELEGLAAGDAGEEERRFVTEAQKLLDAYTGSAPVYNELAQMILAKEQSNDQLAQSMLLEFDELDRLQSAAIADFELVQASYMDGG